MKNFDIIERYLNGEMSPEEKAGFEERLQQDPDFNAEYRKHLEVYDALKDKDVLKLREKLNKIVKESRKRKRGTSFGRNRLSLYWFTASAALILILFTLFLIFVINPEGKDRQFAQSESQVTSQSELPESYFELKELITRGEEADSWQPADSTIFSYGEPIVFRFASEADPSFVLEVYHSTGELIYKEGSGPGSTLSMIEPLKKGTYYYKVRSGDSLRYIGYFIINR